jgi:hypothetical protein
LPKLAACTEVRRHVRPRGKLAVQLSHEHRRSASISVA